MPCAARSVRKGRRFSDEERQLVHGRRGAAQGARRAERGGETNHPRDRPTLNRIPAQARRPRRDRRGATPQAEITGQLSELGDPRAWVDQGLRGRGGDARQVPAARGAREGGRAQGSDRHPEVAVRAMRLSGYAARWWTVSSVSDLRWQLGGPDNVRERFARGCFHVEENLRAGNEVKVHWCHQKSWMIARTGDGSLRLAENEHGLKFEIELGDDFDRLVNMVRNRRVPGMSVGFREPKWTIDIVDQLREVPVYDKLTRTLIGMRREVVREQVRTVTRAILTQVSFALSPAYPGTTVSADDGNVSLAILRRRLELEAQT